MSQQEQANKRKKLDPFTLGIIIIVVAVVFFMPAIGSKDEPSVEQIVVEEPETITVIVPENDPPSLTGLSREELQSILTLGHSGISEDGSTVDPAAILLQLDVLIVRVDAAMLEMKRVKDTALDMRAGLQRHLDYLHTDTSEAVESTGE